MTLAVARIFGDRILMLSDTMLSGAKMARPDMIPGQLKTIVLGLEISVSYAGISEYAIGSIRQAKKRLEGSAQLDAVLEGLATATVSGPDVDFIVMAHRPQASLYLIRHGRIVAGSDRYAIGDEDVIREFEREFKRCVKTEHRPDPSSRPDYVHPEEGPFSSAFYEVIYETRSPVVGGLPVYCLGSPHGHCYLNTAGTHAWDRITIPMTEAEAAAHSDLVRTGTVSFTYTMVAPDVRGIALMGAYLEYGSMGFVYSPLEEGAEVVRKYCPVTLESLKMEVEGWAARLALKGRGTHGPGRVSSPW